MSKQIEALKLALEALERHAELGLLAGSTITAIREALADSALDRMAENARELGLDYEPPCKTGSQCTSKCQQCEQPAQQQEPIRVPVTDNTYGYAKSLAEAIFKQHFASDEHYASGRIVWGVNDTVIGILTQIDNMVADMVRRPAQQQEPVAWVHLESWMTGKYWPDDCFSALPVDEWRPLYTSPPASKPWVGLTEEEVDECYYWKGRQWTTDELVRHVEAKLREKNA